MSTFDGIVQEFPFIQIDYFRKNPERPLPLACFLSHVHSDHLQGLESFRAPFIYCSAATRELLLRIEKYPHRMNFNKGILESRRLHYKHLYKLLRPIPLNTPTKIELTPRLSIRVTLFDANHCTGAVMFLIEGDGKAILYTGDIRAESWWVNNLVRNPTLIPYTLGGNHLDKIYLDTTFARATHLHRKFPSKAEGLAELLRKVKPYPEDTVFYFRAWTFGYEEVWMALSAALNAKIHVDRYQLGLYKSVSNARGENGANEASALCGFELGNRFVPGCLSDDKNSRIHSCESDLPCSVARSKETVYIEPIVSRLQDGSQLPEVGIGGGAGDLYQVHELELPDQVALKELDRLCLERIHDNQVLSQTRDALFEAFRSKRKTLSLDSYGMKDDQDIPLEKLVTILSRGHTGDRRLSASMQDSQGHQLPNRIQFPYSRHSSYMELCELVSAFKPKDVFPCTTDPLSWDEHTSIRTLFGHLCSGDQFSHDMHMRETIANDEELLRSRKRACYEVDTSLQSSQPSESFMESGPRVCDSFSSELDPEPEPDPDPEQNQNPSTKPTIMNTNLSSSSSTSTTTGRILLPSSMEPIPEHPPPPTNPNKPLFITSLTPENEHAKRNEIRHARQYLQSNLPDGIAHLGPLPSSWPPEEEDRLGDSHPKNKNENENENADIVVDLNLDGKVESLPRTASCSPPSSSPSSPSHNPNKEVENNRPNDNENDNDHDDTNQAESQLTNPLSIPDSAFVSSFSSSQGQGQEEDYPHSQPHLTLPNGPSSSSLSTTTAISRKNRKAAYLAARADNFENWNLVSLVSAGNNHTEEEVEL